MNKRSGDGKPGKDGLDDAVVAFMLAAAQIQNTLLQGKEARTRDMILRCSKGVIMWGLLRTMQYPRDVGLIEQLVELNLVLTSHLDDIVLNASSDDPALQKLCELAEHHMTWATFVRPGDPKFSESKLQKLKVGTKVSGPSLPIKAARAPSLATEANRLALRLTRQLSDSVESVLYIIRDGVKGKKTLKEVRRDLLLIGLPEQKHTEYVKILRRVELYPFSGKTLKQWGGILADCVLFVGPERFPELKFLLQDEAL